MAEYPGSTSRDYTTTASGVADDASVSIAAVAGEHICIQRIDFSSAADGAHTLTIKEDTAAAPASYNQTKWTLQITKGGPGPIMGNDAPVYVGTKGRGIQVALATNSSTTGSVNVLYY
tara:strand:- start:164 stop:517 length:354 start_codon:yes stop_codon:yes gene_type:complete